MPRKLDENLYFNDVAIDSHHGKILLQYKMLADAVRDGNSTVMINKLANFLEHYTNEHFDAEDLIMLQYRYPEIKEHRREHQEFEDSIKELKKRLDEEGATRNLAVAATGLLYRYIINHMNKTDKDLALYLRERKPR